MLLEVALLSKGHLAAGLGANVGLVLGVAAQMGEELRQRRHHAGTPREVARENLQLPFAFSPLQVVDRVIVRAGNAVFVTIFHQKFLSVSFPRNLRGDPVWFNAVLCHELSREELAAGLVL